jgi:imidazole glycerol-phosphate synthase subunit HisH
MTEVTVIDYGLGNLYSVQRGLEQCGATVNITADPKEILSAERLILPGVGAFGNAMNTLNRLALADVVREFASSGKPLLGICLGMQLLLDGSEEFGEHRGLSIIPGRVVPIPTTTVTGEQQKIPHIGWNALVPAEGQEAHWKNSLMSGVDVGSAVYFVHSFMALPDEAADRLSDCQYGGHSVAAVIRRGNVVGCQFHPEKSGKTGLAMLKAFCALQG